MRLNPFRRTTTPTPADRVQAGARLLDREVPGWDQRVPANQVRVQSTRDCVLGHVFGHYITGLDALGLSDRARISEHGFSTSDHDWDSWLDYSALNREWAAEIVRRQHAKV